MTQKKREETEKGRDVEEKVNQPIKIFSRIVENMKKILYVFLITCFSLTIFSCAKKDGSSGTATSFWSEQIGTSSYEMRLDYTYFLCLFHYPYFLRYFSVSLRDSGKASNSSSVIV